MNLDAEKKKEITGSDQQLAGDARGGWEFSSVFFVEKLIWEKMWNLYCWICDVCCFSKSNETCGLCRKERPRYHGKTCAYPHCEQLAFHGDLCGNCHKSRRNKCFARHVKILFEESTLLRYNQAKGFLKGVLLDTLTIREISNLVVEYLPSSETHCQKIFQNGCVVEGRKGVEWLGALLAARGIVVCALAFRCSNPDWDLKFRDWSKPIALTLEMDVISVEPGATKMESKCGFLLTRMSPPSWF
jgi:hypothetical protein